MKIFKSGMLVAMLMVIFTLGFANVADAAFAGKRAVVETELSAPVAAPVTPAPPAADEMTVLLVILAILLPPLAVFLKYNEVGTPFVVNIILTLLFWLPGVIHALYHVLR